MDMLRSIILPVLTVVVLVLIHPAVAQSGWQVAPEGAAVDSAAPVIVERPDFAAAFEEAGVSGTFVVHDAARNVYLVHDLERAHTRFIPASTFKIPNSLIALQTGVVTDTAEVIPWDGRERAISAWNRDHSMTSAFRYSVVPFYQEVARRIGPARMKDFVSRIEFGNNDVGGEIDGFWLHGDLRISPMEQIDFLQRLHEGNLPFSEEVVAAVRDVMVEEDSSDYVLRGKTGWALRESTDVGWYVGYVERGDRVYYFALNMDITDPEQGALRKQLARKLLASLDLM